MSDFLDFLMLDPKTATTYPTIVTPLLGEMRNISPPLPNHNSNDITGEIIPTLGKVLPIVETLKRIKIILPLLIPA